jgi:curved DNA-binding protein CbpA
VHRLPISDTEPQAVNSDPFVLLGLSRSAGTAEIDAAYELLAAVFDPRRWSGAIPSVQAEAIAWSEALSEAREAALNAVDQR